MSELLKTLLATTRQTVEEAKKIRSVRVLENWIKNIPPAKDFKSAITGGCLIAEVKIYSPAYGQHMNPVSVNASPKAYQNSPIVHAVSVLTHKNFNASIDVLRKVQKVVTKPILRKDLIIEEYQIIEARAFGADAILLMGSILDAATYQRLHAFARSLGLHVLCESHSEEDIAKLPSDVEICGINSRNFYDDKFFVLGKFMVTDVTTKLRAFNLVGKLPKGTIKVAESSIDASNFIKVMSLGFDAALVGTSLLNSDRGVVAELQAFENAAQNAGNGGLIAREAAIA
jgi:indole-3-glycerol phosphate synthase